MKHMTIGTRLYRMENKVSGYYEAGVVNVVIQFIPDVADDCDGAEAGGYLPRNQRAASPPGGAHRLESFLSLDRRGFRASGECLHILNTILH